MRQQKTLGAPSIQAPKRALRVAPRADVGRFLRVGLWVGTIFWVGPGLVRAQEVRVELPKRVPAEFMSYQGAGWLERPERVAEENPDDMLAAMGLKNGDVVADIGAGSGFHTRRMARLVAPAGRVYAVDIQPEMLEILRVNIEEEGVTGVVPVLSEFDDPKLPEGEIDWILLVDVYHEFGNHEAMLAKMRGALKPDGKVALVEYRVEDGSGDHIKGDHRMSVRQVLSEWGPAGFDLVALHEFLPSQHLFVFRPTPNGAAEVEPTQAIPDYDLLEAIEGGHVEVSATILGPETVALMLNRTRPEPMVITLPVGTYFETPESTSDLIARRDGAVVLFEDGPQSWTVLARLADPTLPRPAPQEVFEIRSADEHVAMRNVMWVYQGINLHPMVEGLIQQLSLSIASENAGYDELAELASGAPVAAEEAIGLAAAYVDSSGMDITRTQLWAERERFLPAITDPGLRRFFESLDQR